MVILIIPWHLLAAQELEPLSLAYQGYITDLSHQAINGERDIHFKIYNARVGGELIWSEDHISVNVIDGDFQVNIGLITPLPITESPDTPLFLPFRLRET